MFISLVVNPVMYICMHVCMYSINENEQLTWIGFGVTFSSVASWVNGFRNNLANM